MTVVTWPLVGAFLAALAAPAAAQDSVAGDLAALKARQMYVEGDDTGAFVEATRLDALGAPRATLLLGFFYEHGLGTAADPVRAVALYRKAAEAGHPEAMYNLGLGYRDGLGGLPPDPAQARGWLARAAELDFAPALSDYGVMLRDGTGGPADGRAARAALERAVSLGDLDALAELGWMLADGLGVPPDLPRAREVYRQAALRGHDWGSRDYAEMLERGEGGPVDLAGAAQWYQAAAQLGQVMAAFDLFELYAAHPTLAPDPLAGLVWCYWAEAKPALADGTDFDGKCAPGEAGLSPQDLAAARTRAAELGK